MFGVRSPFRLGVPLPLSLTHSLGVRVGVRSGRCEVFGGELRGSFCRAGGAVCGGPEGEGVVAARGAAGVPAWCAGGCVLIFRWEVLFCALVHLWAVCSGRGQGWVNPKLETGPAS